MDSNLKNIMRRTTWFKAKGELLSILEWYVSEQYGDKDDKDFEIMNKKIEEFIKWIEEESPIA